MIMIYFINIIITVIINCVFKRFLNNNENKNSLLNTNLIKVVQDIIVPIDSNLISNFIILMMLVMHLLDIMINKKELIK